MVTTIQHGNIICTKTEISDMGGYVIGYRWEGPDTTRIDRRALDNHGILRPQAGQVVNIGPFRVRLIEENFIMAEWLAIRERTVTTWLRWQWHRFGKTADKVYRRLIITAAVWGLAHFSPYAIPSYRDLYVYQWYKRKRA